MPKPAFPSDQQDKFMLRLPAGLRDRIKVAAADSGRSMNSEIVATLERAYPARAPLEDRALEVIAASGLAPHEKERLSALVSELSRMILSKAPDSL